MTLFLDDQTLYRILQRESPADVYADGAPSAFFTTADQMSFARVVRDGYTNLGNIYNNIWPQTTDEFVSQWETLISSTPLPVLPTLLDRQNRILNKLRTRNGISAWDVATFVANYVPEGTYIQIIEKGSPRGGWRLSRSKLSLETYFGSGRLLTGQTTCDNSNIRGWRLSQSKLSTQTYFGSKAIADGLTQAYTYVVKIYDYTFPTDVFNKFLIDLTAFEPARSQHIVYQGLPIAGTPFQTLLPQVGQFDNILLIARDSTSPTGYKGRTI